MGSFLERLSGGSLRVRETLHNNTEGSSHGPEGTWLVTPWKLNKLLDSIFYV